MAYGGAGDKHVPDDEIERRLRELTNEVAGASRVRQPEQAAGRAKNADRALAHAGRRGMFTTWVIVIAVLAAGGLTLRGGAPAAYADLLISRQRSAFITGLDKIGRDKQGFALSTRQRVTSFAPGTTAFVTTVVKAHGSMSAGTAVLSGTRVLRVWAGYLFAYAIEPPGHPADWMRVVQQRYGYVDFAQWDDPGGSLEPFVALSGSSAGGLCGMADGYIHPAYPYGAQSGVRPSGPSVNPYATATPSSSSAYMCQPTTGT